jgi:DNA modification methylase
VVTSDRQGRNWRLLVGDVIERLAELPDESAHCCVTSPPYWGLRDYGCDGQIGLESTPEEFVARLVEVFRQVRRVLRPDGTLWLNIGDSYATGGGAVGRCPGGGEQGERFLRQGHINTQPNRMPIPGLKPKDLVGVPWMLAFALRADGWFLRSEIIWHKPAPMPESVRDRPTKAHEQIFLLAKSRDYFYDNEAIKEPLARPDEATRKTPAVFGGANKWQEAQKQSRLHSGNEYRGTPTGTRNARSVWTLSQESYAGAHFATFPTSIPSRAIKAGTSEIGCCPDCGTPWQRRTEKTALKRERPNAYVKRSGEEGTGNSCANDVAGVATRTVGWELPCNHIRSRGQAVPCTVLEPFAGSGTTLRVALELGRAAIGVELNAEYAELAEKRITAPLEKPAERHEPAAGQRQLFEVSK